MNACGCRIDPGKDARHIGGVETREHIVFCPLHERAERLAETLAWAEPHIGTEYERSWPHDADFDAGVERVRSLLKEIGR